MKTSEIRLKIELDDKNIPEKLFWHADDGPSAGLEEAKAFNLSLWDGNRKDTLSINLWAKDMPLHEMKRFYIDMLGGMAKSIMQSTNDELMAGELEMLCQRLAQHVTQENAKQ
ncbi:MAG: gliding motility protein GldC [Flammeovirgaceae bacterium]